MEILEGSQGVIMSVQRIMGDLYTILCNFVTLTSIFLLVALL